MGQSRLERLQAILPKMTDGQLLIVERIIDVFSAPHTFTCEKDSDILDAGTVNDFGDALMIHHCFSAQPLTKDKFEYALESILKANHKKAELSRKGNPGWDLKIDDTRFSLKTQADSSIKLDTIHISKFMELGGGSWSDKDEDLHGLRQQFFNHLEQYDRILTLRTLRRPPPDYFYELVEIPKDMLLLAKDGRFEMKHSSTQMPKPGYCYVSDDRGECFQLYFDGGGERKLQVKALRKNRCKVHATWKFDVSASQTIPDGPAETS